MGVKNIAWIKYNSALDGIKFYGVANNSKGEAIGGVRIDYHDKGVYAVAYNLSFRPFDEKVTSTKISDNYLVGEAEIKKKANLSLIKLLEAA